MEQFNELIIPRRRSFAAESKVKNVDNHELNRYTNQTLGALAVMSINMNGQPSWYPDEPKKQWTSRAPLVRDVIASELPEIIGTQEFGQTTKEDVFDPWEGNPYTIYKGSQVNDIFINPIAWNSERFTMQSQLTHWLTPDGRFGKVWGGIERGYSAVLLEDQHSNSTQPLWIYNVHLDNVSALARFEGIKLLLRDIKERTEDLPTAITGDLNSTSWPVPPPPHEDYYESKAPISAHSDQEMFKHLEAAGFTDTNPTRQAGDPFPPPTFHAYLGENIHQQPDKFGTWNPDGIFVRGLGIQAFKIITTSRDGVYPSDHYPISATLSGITESARPHLAL